MQMAKWPYTIRPRATDRDRARMLYSIYSTIHNLMNKCLCAMYNIPFDGVFTPSPRTGGRELASDEMLIIQWDLGSHSNYDWYIKLN